MVTLDWEPVLSGGKPCVPAGTQKIKTLFYHFLFLKFFSKSGFYCILYGGSMESPVTGYLTYGLSYNSNLQCALCRPGLYKMNCMLQQTP